MFPHGAGTRDRRGTQLSDRRVNAIMWGGYLVPKSLRPARSGDVSKPELFIRLKFSEGSFLGPGKVELLEGIEKYGSIVAAGKAMGMSYKRAWYLADEINEMFEQPVVVKKHGGKAGGGAELTDHGREIVAHYRSVQKLSAEAAATHIRKIRKALRKDGTA
ncbi:molybdate transport system regulatory protein [Filomicrobium insigne]|uniref:Molybdate transport system regulatory protein n=2 Tax=Hyphomicrobiaceae TaxID=45401 RepID=A0A1H0H8E0_9HYPH|nr:molybdate transport system regulatory protein [Filomicrobium insigne]